MRLIVLLLRDHFLILAAHHQELEKKVKPYLLQFCRNYSLRVDTGVRVRIIFTAPSNNMRTLKFKAQPTNVSVFCYRQSNVRRLLPAFDCCRARGDQIVV